MLPAELTALLDTLGVELPLVLGANLLGIYLYGSLTQRAFNPKHSDVDCIVVIKRNLSAAQFKRLRAWLTRTSKSNRWTKRLQMSILIRDKVLMPNARAYLYQFGKLKRIRSDGNPIIWTNVLETGRVLFGPKPHTFVPQISRAILFDALKREVGYLREELIDKPRSQWRDVPFYRAYAAMTLCRIMYSFERGKVVSKPRAALWAMNHLPSTWRGIIVRAVEHDAGRRASLPIERLRRFVEFVEEQLGAGAR
jgi:hypothetical protein